MATKRVYKTTITLAVLSLEPLGDMDLSTIVDEADTGEFVADERRGEPEPIEGMAKIRKELKAMRNDGCFFDGAFEED